MVFRMRAYTHEAHRQRVSTTFLTRKNSVFLVSWRNSNPAPLGSQSNALTTEPTRHPGPIRTIQTKKCCKDNHYVHLRLQSRKRLRKFWFRRDSEAIEVIIIKLGAKTASDMLMHHVVIILTVTSIQGHTDLNHEINKCFIISETVQAIPITFAMKIVRLK